MPQRLIPRIRLGVVIGMLLLLACSRSVIAEEYLIGPGDVLDISYWQQPELNQQITVRQNGKITLAIIGELQAAGQTTSRLEQFLVERISRMNKNISQVVVTVAKYQSKSVFIGGQVANPGLMYFEVIPDLWETIKLAGGPTETADLGTVTVLRSAEEGGGVLHVDLATILATGELDRLPPLHPGYTVTIQRLPEGLSTERFTEPSQRKKLFYAYGSVVNPGRHAMDTEIDLLEALVLAGGPGPQADLHHVRVISKSGGTSVIHVIDLDRYGQTGGPRRYLIQREDAIFVPAKRRGLFAGTWNAVRDLLAVGGTIASVVLILTR